MPRPGSPPEKTRRLLLLWAWALLALSLLLCLAGPWLAQRSLSPDIGPRADDTQLAGLGWIIVGMITGALALMCFVAQWVLRSRNHDADRRAPLERRSSNKMQGRK